MAVAAYSAGAYAFSEDGKTVYTAYGDDITDPVLYGEQGIDTYADILNMYFGFDEYNNLAKTQTALSVDSSAGVSGIDIISENAETNINSDIISIYYGMNDWIMNVPIGTVEDEYPEDGQDRQNTTFLGAFVHAVELLRSQNPDVEIIVIAPAYMTYNGSALNANGDSLCDYAKALEQACKYVSVKCVNLYSKSGLQSQTLPLYTLDGVIPNQTGHNRIANLCRGDMKKLLGLNNFDVVTATPTPTAEPTPEPSQSPQPEPTPTPQPSPTPEPVFEEFTRINPDAPKLYTNIADVVDISRGNASGYDIYSNMPVFDAEQEYTWTKTFFNDGVQNFYMTTAGANIFGLFSDGTYTYGVYLNNSPTYGDMLMRIDETEDTTVYSASGAVCGSVDISQLPQSYERTQWHISYSETKQMWYFYIVENGGESFVCRISREDLENAALSPDLSGTEPDFAVIHFNTAPFVLNSDPKPAALATVYENGVVNAALLNTEGVSAISVGAYSDGELVELRVPEIKANTVSAKFDDLDNADTIKIFFWSDMESMTPMYTVKEIRLNGNEE